jgi:hypothetical protein
MAHALHRLVLATSDLIAGRLAHGRGVGPVVLAREHVYWAFLGVDAGHAAAAIPSTWSRTIVSTFQNTWERMGVSAELALMSASNMSLQISQAQSTFMMGIDILQFSQRTVDTAGLIFCLPKVHVQIAMEDTIRLRRIQVPNELSIDKRRGGRHHLSIKESVIDPIVTIERHYTYAVNPLRVEQ